MDDLLLGIGRELRPLDPPPRCAPCRPRAPRRARRSTPPRVSGRFPRRCWPVAARPAAQCRPPCRRRNRRRRCTPFRPRVAVTARMSAASRFVTLAIVPLLSARIETTVRAARARTSWLARDLVVASTNAAVLSRETIGRWRGSPSLRRTSLGSPPAQSRSPTASARSPLRADRARSRPTPGSPSSLPPSPSSPVWRSWSAGVVTSLARRGGRIGDLALLAGFLWFAPLWAGWKGGPPLVLSLGTLAAGFTFPLLLHIVVASPTGVLRSKGARALVVAVYLEAALSALGRALFRDPFFDPTCWDNCTDNVFLVRSLPDVARAIQDVDLWFAVAAAAGARGGLRPAGSPRPAARPGGRCGLSSPAASHSQARRSRIRSRSPAFRSRTRATGPSRPSSSSAARRSSVIALGLPWALVQARIQRRSVARIVADLGEAPVSRLARARARQSDRRPRAANRLLAARRAPLRRRSRRAGPRARARVRARGHPARPGRPPGRRRHAHCGGRRARARDRRRRPARARERTPAGRGAGAAPGSARVTHADRRDRRRRAAPARARPPRRRPAAAAGALVRPAARARRRGRRRRRGARPECWTPPATRPRPPWTSCASSPTASIRRSSPRRDWRPRSRRSPTRRRCRWSSTRWRRSASRPRSRRRPT